MSNLILSKSINKSRVTSISKGGLPNKGFDITTEVSNNTTYKTTFNSYSDWATDYAGNWTLTFGLNDHNLNPVNLVQFFQDNGTSYISPTQGTWAINKTSQDLVLTITGPAYASQTLTATDIVNGNTVTINGKTYTFQTTLTDVNGNVALGLDLEATLLNLYNAINLTGEAGVDYADAMTQHTTVSAVDVTATTLTVRANDFGTGANSFGTTSVGDDLGWDDTTLLGGTTVAATGVLTFSGTGTAADTVTIGSTVYTLVGTLNNNTPNQILIGGSATLTATNMEAAINATEASRGILFSSPTLAHSLVRATRSGAAVTAIAHNGGSASNSIATTDNGTGASWGAGTLTSGAGNDYRYTGVVIIKK